MTAVCTYLEAILFSAGEPVPLSRLSLVLGVSELEVLDAAQELQNLLDEGGHGICLLCRQSLRAEFVDIAARAHSAEVHRLCQVCLYQVDHEFTALFYYVMRIALRLHGDVCHRRIRVDDSGPGDRYDVWFLHASAADHYRWYGCKKRSGF